MFLILGSFLHLNHVFYTFFVVIIQSALPILIAEMICPVRVTVVRSGPHVNKAENVEIREYEEGKCVENIARP